MDLVFVLHWPFHFQVPIPVIVLGLVVGLSYSVLALGLVLIYKSSRIINLAHGEVGAVAAVVLAILVKDHHVPYWVAFFLALGVAGALGGVVEATVIRRLRKAPRLIVLVATLGVAQLFLLTTYILTKTVKNTLGGYPQPFTRSFNVGKYLVLNVSHLMILLLVPLATLALIAFFRFTSFGVGVRASAENGDLARAVGIPTRRVSSFVWMLAAALSGLTAIMLAPGKGLFTTESLGPGLLMRAMAAAVVGRMTSLPRTFAAGIGIGVIEQVVFWNRPIGGEVELVLFLVILGALLFQTRRKQGARAEESSSWQLTQVARPVPRELQGIRWIRWMNWGLGLFALAIAAVLPMGLSNSQTFLLTTVVCFSVVALSVTLLTGYAGQISLGQIGLFGVGAAASYQFTANASMPFVVSLVAAGLVGAALSVAIGIPALRIKGLFLAVTTLGFALVAQKWLLGQDWMAGVGVIAPRPYMGPINFASQRSYYFIALAGLVVAVLLTRNLLRSGIGRNFVAVRDNELGAAAFTVPLTRTKLMAFGAAGFLAAFAGAIYGHGIQGFSVNNFGVAESLRIVSVAIMGGLGSIPGAVAGAAFVYGIDRLVHVAQLRLASTSIGLLAILMFLPGGFAQLMYGARDLLFKRVLAKRGSQAVVEEASAILEPANAQLVEAAEILESDRTHAVASGTSEGSR